MASENYPSSSSSTAPNPYFNSNGREVSSSASSTHSRGPSDRSPRGNGHPAVESAVTRLLVAIKQLLEALTQWSQLKMTETEVSDVYVRLGNDFNAAVAAFGQFGIDMSELLSVPEDLRAILEQCLSEDATPKNLDIYQPSVRQIITNLLQGLRTKQHIYRRIVSERKQRDPDGQPSERGERAERAERTDSRSYRQDGRSSRGDSIATASSISGHTRHGAVSEDGPQRPSSQTSQRQRRTLSSSRNKIDTRAHASLPAEAPIVEQRDENFAGGFVHPRVVSAEQEGTRQRRSDPMRQSVSEPNGQPMPPMPPPEAIPVNPPPRESSRFSAASSVSGDAPTNRATSPPPPQPPVPPNVQRFSLTDKPMPPPSLLVEGGTPPPSDENLASGAGPAQINVQPSSPPSTPPIDASQVPLMANSLAALKKSDTLERRASKRFSTYNISKMTGVRERPNLSKSMNRRSMAADSSMLTPNELDELTEVDETQEGNVPAEPSRSPSRARDMSPRKARTPARVAEASKSPLPSIPDAEEAPPPPPQKKPSVVASAPTAQKGKQVAAQNSDTESFKTPPSQYTVFLQVGRQVKKVQIEPGLSFSSLRVLFVDKFSYSPGKENFPSIYIRDPSSGVQYELEDPDEVKDGCLLSLNIEPLDQIKQHIDTQMSTLSQELKELRTMINHNPRRISHPPTPIMAQPFVEEPSLMPNRPTDKQFARVARRLSRIVPNGHAEGADAAPKPQIAITPDITGQTLFPQTTGGSLISDASAMRIVSDLKTQFDEVQNLRRDLGVMRQLYTDFASTTKESLSALRNQAQNVRQLATTSVGGARAYINSGKANLDSRTQAILTRIEDLQDTVETLRDDVIKRSVNPRMGVVKNVQKDMKEAAEELNSLKDYINTVKPMWKKTWEEELQNIVEEQQFLSHQEEFFADLMEDHKAVTEIFGHIEKVISIRGSSSAKSRGVRLPPQEEGPTDLNTVFMQIRGAAVDPSKRLKAIAANEKQREKELASRSDEFENELQDFVSGRKLKMTGGAEEAERVRQKRNDLALKAMFNAGTSMPSTSAPSLTTPPANSSP